MKQQRDTLGWRIEDKEKKWGADDLFQVLFLNVLLLWWHNLCELVKMLLTLIKIHVSWIMLISNWMQAIRVRSREAEKAEVAGWKEGSNYYVCREVKVASNIAIMWPDFCCKKRDTSCYGNYSMDHWIKAVGEGTFKNPLQSPFILFSWKCDGVVTEIGIC